MDSPQKPFGFIENCNWRIAVNCPRRWESLDATEKPGVRHCFTCLKDVYRCETEDELQQRVAEGKCVAYMYVEDDFVGLLTPLDD